MAVDNGNHIKAVHELELVDGTITQNVFYFVCNFDSQQTNAAVLAAIKLYVEGIYSPLSAYLHNGSSINPCQVDKIAWDAGEGKWLTTAQVGQTTPVFSLSGAGDPFPNQIAPVIRANTSRPKSYGKKFLMHFVETSAAGSDLTSAVLTALATTLANYLADETVSGTSVLSPGVPRTNFNTFLEFTDGVVNSVVGTQRRRKPGIGA